MIAGLPGTGIGGLFYLISALWMPFRELGLTVMGRSSIQRWHTVVGQAGIAAGIVAGIVGVAWLLTLFLPHLGGEALSRISSGFGRLVGIHPFLLVLASLGALLAFVETLRLIFTGRPKLTQETSPRSPPR